MKKKNEFMNRIISSFIVLSMILTGFTVLFIGGPSSSVLAEYETQIETPLLRVYGEESAVYPTHSYYGENDFIYPIESDPFDPGVIEKDSITFNPAFLHGHEEYEIKAQGDASEKVFLRAFYEPRYTHDIDVLMDSWSDVILQPIETFDGIITETTYFLTTLEKTAPLVGYPGATSFAFPYQSTDSWLPGMEHADLVDLVCTDDNNGSIQLTDGAIKIEKEFEFNNIDYTQDLTISFLDHKVVIKNFEENEPWDKLDLDVSYIGNMYEEIPYTETHTIWEDSWSISPSFEYYFNRANHMQPTTDPAYRWYLRIENADEDYLRITLGRWLYAGETFYVDGVRYDMPAIYVNEQGGFKYITLQSPIPKSDPIDNDIIWYSTLEYNVDDWSHVTSQYLASLPMNHCIWVLPPFNMDHRMIDDIGLQKYDDNCMKIPVAGILIEGWKQPLCFTYVDETIEPRFDTSLAERLNTTSTNDINKEYWEWYNVYTKPYRYTEFMLPDQEIIGEPYDIDDIPSWYPFSLVDGYEYLITTSLIAPNSHADLKRDDLCKVYDEHEIYDRVVTISLNDERSEYYQFPRVVYEHDAVDATDLYVNEDDPNPTARIYGEENIYYPTHSYYGENDFIYPIESDPFDPGVIEKDSITFNPAFLHGHEEYEIKAQGDASEKVFLRTFYEPEYTHDTDLLLDSWSDVILEPIETFDSIITETTYFLTTLEKTAPLIGYPGTTSFAFPYQSTDSWLPGMEHADLVDLVCTDDNNGSIQLTDGAIKIEKEFEFNNIDYTQDLTISFLDHKVVIKNFEENEPWDKLDLDVSYIGNMYEEIPYTETHTIWEDSWSIAPSFEYYFNRANHMQPTTDPAYRWYLRVENADEDYLRITLGRWLYAGETFYVDGVRYDMPAIYVNEQGGFKYITLQSPIPKGEVIWDHQLTHNVDDWSHVTSQYLASLPMNHCIWVLPPFNMDHRMIDDIGLQKYDDNCMKIPADGLLIEGWKQPLCFTYVDETIEHRFNTSLAERLYTNMFENMTQESWEWYNVYTKPYRYTEFMLPDQEVEGESYDSDDIPSWYPYQYADGSEYLITSSFYAPNSKLDTDRRDLCKTFDDHEIYTGVQHSQINNDMDGTNDIELAVQLGLEYLVNSQNTDGSWGLSSHEYIATTALVLLKLEHRAHDLGVDPFENDSSKPRYYEYANAVIKGMDFLLDGATIITPLPVQTHGDPDTNGNGFGIAFAHGISHREIYSTGLALCALSLSGHPHDRVHMVGCTNFTYLQIAQEAVDWMAYAQIDSGTGRGGWRYEANYATGDNSNSGYATLGLDYAEEFGCNIPSFVKPEMNIWIDYIQNDVNGDTNDGGSGYESPSNWVNILKTGNLLQQMAFYGDTPLTLRVQDAVDYLERHWRDTTTDPGWGYNSASDYQAIFTTMKGLQTIGIPLIDTDGDGASDNDWFKQDPAATPAQDFVTVLLAEQNADGSWPTDTWGHSILTTAWALLTLEKSTPAPPQIYHPRFVFDFDGHDGTGLFINGDENIPPVCDCGGPYIAGPEQSTIELNGCGSFDPDGIIVKYEWNVYFIIPPLNINSCSIILDIDDYPPGIYPIELCVTDDDGAITCCETTLYIEYPPLHCDCNGPYVAGNEQCCVTFDGCSSIGDIVTYMWHVDGLKVYEGPECLYNLQLDGYSPGYHDVELCVYDAHGQMDCCQTTLYIEPPCSAYVMMESGCIIEEAETIVLCLTASDFTEFVGSGQWSIRYDPTVVHVLQVDGSEFQTLNYYDNGIGILNITVFSTTVPLTSDFVIACITFEKIGDIGECSPIEIRESLLFTAEPVPSDICHTITNGEVCIGCPDLLKGDMNDDSSLNSADIRYLAMYLTGDPLYKPLFSDGDVNSDGRINSADVRYLAMYLTGDPLYRPLYPTI